MDRPVNGFVQFSKRQSRWIRRFKWICALVCDAGGMRKRVVGFNRDKIDRAADLAGKT